LELPNLNLTSKIKFGTLEIGFSALISTFIKDMGKTFMKKLFLLFVALVIFQTQASAYMPESITDLKITVQKHVFGPLNIKQQSNAFIEGLLFGFMGNFSDTFLVSSKDDNIRFKGMPKFFLRSSLPLLQFSTIVSHISSGKSLSIAARATGCTMGYVVMGKICSRFKNP
jgi:hypothetical protein